MSSKFLHLDLLIRSLVIKIINFSLFINDSCKHDLPKLVIATHGHVRPGSDAVLHMSRIEFEFRPTQINLDRLN